MLLSLIGGVLLTALYYFGFIRFNYPSLKTYPIRGIDVSHHQGSIDWSKLKTEKISFVFIKATEGNDFVDPKFLSNWNNARKHGLAVGAYHFFTFCSSASDQANNFIKTVPKVKGSLPAVIDIEFIGSCKHQPSINEYQTSVQIFINLVKNHYAQEPIIYSTYESYKGYLDTLFVRSPLWMRDIYSKPSLGNRRQWLFWQYSNRGRINGINAYVDLNVFKKDLKSFKSLLSK